MVVHVQRVVMSQKSMKGRIRTALQPLTNSLNNKQHILKTLIAAITLITLSASFTTSSAQKNSVHKVIVKEVLQTRNYSYLNVTENDSTLWLTVLKLEAKPGDIYYFLDNDGFVTQNFESKELARKFGKVVFLNKIYTDEQQLSSNAPLDETNSINMIENYHQQNKKDAFIKGKIVVEKAKDGITISELFSNKDKYANKEVVIRGQIVKYNDSIMGRNWVHLQDGTESNSTFDLTITTAAQVKIGEIVTFRGKIALNKDFGYGYSYEIIMEDAQLMP
jgi:hypothetical protein